ncbi:MAG TPA: Uma2 family endonuclease [Terracidiphilus sp.]|nr:Uma2 family endonuclease [Terracidiphilus sp.]
MATVLRIDPETLPRTLALDPPVTEAEFEEMCRESGAIIRFERTKEGIVRMNPPTGGFTGNGNKEITRQLGNWEVAQGRGRAFDSNTAFRLPDGSILSPDASYLSEERLRTLPKGGLRGFPRVCPDFVIELVSESDPLQTVKEKMNDWIANGAQLAWLIDPYQRQVLVFRPSRAAEVVTGDRIAGEGPVNGLVLDLARVWKCYEE